MVGDMAIGLNPNIQNAGPIPTKSFTDHKE
jgi:hypothetical protein